jgi:hypothetical protein
VFALFVRVPFRREHLGAGSAGVRPGDEFAAQIASEATGEVSHSSHVGAIRRFLSRLLGLVPHRPRPEGSSRCVRGDPPSQAGQSRRRRACRGGRGANSAYKLRDKAAKSRRRRFANYTIQVLRLLFTWAIRRGKMRTNPATAVEFVKPPRGAKEANRPWTAAELDAVLEAAPEELRAAIEAHPEARSAAITRAERRPRRISISPLLPKTSANSPSCFRCRRRS